jgi:hypothetical protein
MGVWVACTLAATKPNNQDQVVARNGSRWGNFAASPWGARRTPIYLDWLGRMTRKEWGRTSIRPSYRTSIRPSYMNITAGQCSRA